MVTAMEVRVVKLQVPSLNLQLQLEEFLEVREVELELPPVELSVEREVPSVQEVELEVPSVEREVPSVQELELELTLVQELDR